MNQKFDSFWDVFRFYSSSFKCVSAFWLFSFNHIQYKSCIGQNIRKYIVTPLPLSLFLCFALFISRSYFLSARVKNLRAAISKWVQLSFCRHFSSVLSKLYSSCAYLKFFFSNNVCRDVCLQFLLMTTKLGVDSVNLMQFTANTLVLKSCLGGSTECTGHDHLEYSSFGLNIVISIIKCFQKNKFERLTLGECINFKLFFCDSEQISLKKKTGSERNRKDQNSEKSCFNYSHLKIVYIHQEFCVSTTSRCFQPSFHTENTYAEGNVFLCTNSMYSFVISSHKQLLWYSIVHIDIFDHCHYCFVIGTL